MLCAGVLGSREGQRVDHAAHRNTRLAAFLELEIQESEVEAGVVRDEWRIRDELQEIIDLLPEAGLVGQEQVGEPVHFLRLERHVPLGVEVAMEVAAGFDAVEHLDATDFDDAVPAHRVQTSGLGVENNLTHQRNYLAPATPRQARISRTWPSVVDRSPPVSITKSARSRFSASGNWRARIESSLPVLIPVRRRTRARWIS